MTDTATDPTLDTSTRTVPELLHEFKHVLDARLDGESEKTAAARRVARAALAVAVLAVLATGGLLYYAFYQGLPGLTAPTLRTEGVVLVDGSGAERGLWTVDDNGTATLVLKDADGTSRLKLMLKESGEQGISLSDGTGAVRAVFGHLDDGSSTLTFADANGATRAVFGLSGAEAASLLFADANGGTRAALGVEPTGEPVFWWPDSEVETLTTAP